GSAKRPSSSERQAASGSNAASGHSNGNAGVVAGTQVTYEKNDTKPEKESESAKGQRKAAKADTTGNVPTSTRVGSSDAKPLETGSARNADDGRQAILGLLKAYPSSFATSAQQVQGAPVVQRTGYVEIDRFRCYLQTRTFDYGESGAESGRGNGE